MTRRSDRTRGTRRDRMGYDLKAKAIQGGTGRKMGNSDQYAGLRPEFVVQPVNWSGAEFDTATFTVAVISGDGTSLSYQWQQFLNNLWVNINNGGDVSGAVTDTLVIGNVAATLAGRPVRCVATNTSTSTPSSSATIVITSAIWYILTEVGDRVVDEPATSNVVDERSP